MTAKKRPGEFYRVAKQVASEYPVVEGTRCVQVQIPDDISYLPVLAAMVSSLGNTWASIGGVEARRDWARMWQEAYAATDWGGCMNCEELIACLTPVLAEMTDTIMQGFENFQDFGTTEPGEPMSLEDRTSNLAGETNPSCNLDILWAQCLALIQFTNRQAEDWLERIEAAANIVELAGLSDDIPAVGIVLKFFGVEFATNAVNYFQEALQEGYLAEYTTDKEYELACQLFCLCRDDCVITIDRLFNLFWDNVRDEVPDRPIEMLELLVLLAGIDFTEDTIVDLVFFVLWGFAKLASIMFGTLNGTIALNLLLGLAVNDASNDWELLCECVDLTWCKTWDVTLNDGGFKLYGGYGEYVPGQGWKKSGTGTVIWLYRDDFAGTTITSAAFVVVDYPSTIQLGTPYDTLAVFAGGDFGMNPTIDVSGNSGFANIENMAIRAGVDGIQTFDGFVTEITICGTGLEPDWQD